MTNASKYSSLKKGVAQHEHNGTQYLSTNEILCYSKKHVNILVQVCIFIFIATALIVDARPHNKDAAVATNVTNVNPAETAIALDELSAAELAASVAINSDSLVRDKVIAKVESIGVQEVI